MSFIVIIYIFFRGLFDRTRAVELWGSRDYLPLKFGEDRAIPVVRDGRVGTLQDDRVVVR